MEPKPWLIKQKIRFRTFNLPIETWSKQKTKSEKKKTFLVNRHDASTSVWFQRANNETVNLSFISLQFISLTLLPRGEQLHLTPYTASLVAMGGMDENACLEPWQQVPSSRGFARQTYEYTNAPSISPADEIHTHILHQYTPPTDADARGLHTCLSVVIKQRWGRGK